MKYLIPFILLFALSCSSFGVPECKLTDWLMQGEVDASKGFPAVHYFVQQGLCTGRGNKSDYNYGRIEGLKSYCASKNAFRVGRLGEPYRFVCPKHEDKRFRSRYRLGRDIFRLETEIEDRKEQIDEFYDDLKFGKNLSEFERDDMIEQIQNLKNEQISDQKLIDLKLKEARKSKLIGAF